VIPTCPICKARDATRIDGTQPWGKQWHCCVCDFVYSGSEGEAMHPATKEQRERYEATRRAQGRLGGDPDGQRSAGIEAIQALRETLALRRSGRAS
jgi:phage/plasmid primase-like uncharacterized protein